jgi:hypothetical protein
MEDLLHFFQLILVGAYGNCCCGDCVMVIYSGLPFHCYRLSYLTVFQLAELPRLTRPNAPGSSIVPVGFPPISSVVGIAAYFHNHWNSCERKEKSHPHVSQNNIKRRSNTSYVVNSEM